MNQKNHRNNEEKKFKSFIKFIIK